MADNFVDDVLDCRFVAVAELIAVGADLVELIFQKLHEVIVFGSGHQRDGADQPVATLIGLCERVSQTYDAFVELLGGFVGSKRARIEMDAVGDITGQEEHSDEICGFHISNDTAGQRAQATFLRKGVVSYIGGV